MQTAAMACPACGLRIEGRFGETFFDRLGDDSRRFLEQYLLAGFSIKALEQQGPLGYAAIRTRLDRLIAEYRGLVEADAQKKDIIARLAAGQITPEQAKIELAALKGP